MEAQGSARVRHAALRDAGIPADAGCSPVDQWSHTMVSFLIYNIFVDFCLFLVDMNEMNGMNTLSSTILGYDR